MTVEQGINRFYEEHYGQHAPNNGTSIINALNDILDAEEQDKQIDVGEAAYSVLSLFSDSGGDDEVDGILMKTISGAYTNERVTSIGDYAFYGCTSLTSVDLPAVTSIGEYAFYGCTSLTSVILRNTSEVATLADANAFTNASNAIIYVPDSLVDSYKEADNWSTYASRIKGLSELPTDATESES